LKGQVVEHFPELNSFIYRKNECLEEISNLNKIRDRLLKSIENVTIVPFLDSLNFFVFTGNSNMRTSFQDQCLALAIDMSMDPGERCVYFPPNVGEVLNLYPNINKWNLVFCFEYKVAA
jgi:hypothetical protein